MSDHRTTLIPENPLFVPEAEAAQAALAHFAVIAPEADDFKIHSNDKIQFFDCGENFEWIVCPFCEEELDLEWWQEKMDADYKEGGFRLEGCQLPCCHLSCTLNDLEYDFPQGFARFGVEALNANIGELTDEQIQDFEVLLKTPLRVILQHL